MQGPDGIGANRKLEDLAADTELNLPRMSRHPSSHNGLLEGSDHSLWQFPPLAERLYEISHG